LKVLTLCLVFSLVNDTHILGLAHVISLTFDHFASQLTFVGLFVQPHKCSAWVSFVLSLEFAPLAEFCCPLCGIRILGVPFGFASFASFFLQEALGENVQHGNVPRD